MKGGPAVPGGPLQSKPTRLNILGFNRAGFFIVPVLYTPRKRRPPGTLTE